MKTFRRWLPVLLLAVAVTLPGAARPALGLEAPAPAAAPAAATPTTSYEARFAVEQPPALPFEVVQMVVDFPPGAQVARHTHGGPAYITMLENEITMWMDGEPERTYGPGESWVEPYEVYGSGANLTDRTSRLIVTYLIPVAASVTTLEEGGALTQLPVGASVQVESRLRLDAVPPSYAVAHGLRTYPPGAWTRSERATAPRLLTVIDGQVTVLTGVESRTYARGEHWVEQPGQAWLSGNIADAPAVVAVSTIEPG